MNKYPLSATYWALNKEGSFPYLDEFNKPLLAAPRTIKVRWETQRVLEQDLKEDVSLDGAEVYVQEELDINGFIAPFVSNSTTPWSIVRAFPIREYFETPSLNGRKVVRKIRIGKQRVPDN